jgi:hypothetical protein
MRRRLRRFGDTLSDSLSLASLASRRSSRVAACSCGKAAMARLPPRRWQTALGVGVPEQRLVDRARRRRRRRRLGGVPRIPLVPYPVPVCTRPTPPRPDRPPARSQVCSRARAPIATWTRPGWRWTTWRRRWTRRCTTPAACAGTACDEATVTSPAPDPCAHAVRRQAENPPSTATHPARLRCASAASPNWFLQKLPPGRAKL